MRVTLSVHTPTQGTEQEHRKALYIYILLDACDAEPSPTVPERGCSLCMLREPFLGGRLVTLVNVLRVRSLASPPCISLANLIAGCLTLWERVVARMLAPPSRSIQITANVAPSFIDNATSTFQVSLTASKARLNNVAIGN